ncbi:MAG: hypothetical protein RL250_1315 [Verrucomicrobiota bacterium]|jgi:hypothetical protein
MGLRLGVSGWRLGKENRPSHDLLTSLIASPEPKPLLLSLTLMQTTCACPFAPPA